MTSTFWVPALPERILSSNGGGSGSNQGAKRVPALVAEAKMRLINEVEESIRQTYGTAIPVYTDILDIFVEGHVCYTHRATKEHPCPRCMQALITGDSFKGWCRCYRPRDPSNIGGEVTKPIPDAMQRLGMLAEDDRKHVRWYATSLVEVEDFADEGLKVEVRPVVRVLPVAASSAFALERTG